MAEEQSVAFLTDQFLQWVSTSPRTYADVMDAWRTSCPRLPVWENAVTDGLVRIEPGARMRDAKVVLTAHGRSSLQHAKG